MIVAGYDRDVAEWVQERLPLLELEERDGRPLYTAIGWADDTGRLVAGVVYDTYTRISIDMHIAGVGAWWNPIFSREAFRYPFEQLSVKRVTSRTAADNTVGLRFVKAIGFTYEGRIRQALPGGKDLIILGMLKSECRWLGVGTYGWQGQRAVGS